MGSAMHNVNALINVATAVEDKNVSVRLYHYLMTQKWVVFIGICALILFSLVDAGMIYFIKPLIDDGLNQSNPNTLIQGAYLTVAIFAVRGVASFVSNYCISYAGSNVTYAIRQQVFERVQCFSMSVFNSYSKGTLISKITYDAEQLSEAFLTAIITVIREGIIVMVLLAMMLYASWQLSLIFLIIGPLIALIINIVSKRFRKVSKQLQDGMGGLAKVSDQAFSAHQEILVFNATARVNQDFLKVNNHTRQKTMKLAAVSAISNPVIQLIGAGAIAVILVFASIESILVELSAGTFTMMLLAMGSLLKPLKQLTVVNQKLQKGFVAARSLFTLLDTPVEHDDGNLPLLKCSHEVAFRHLNFSYESHSSLLVKGVSVVFEAGKVSAVVGGSGSGKTTLANLILRLYQAPEKSIFIDDVAIERYSLFSLRQSIAYVSQNVTLIDDTVENNLLFGCDKVVTQQAMHAAIESANVHEFLHTLPNGLQSQIGENGSQLSGGQRQRIAIARALLKQSEILILDEATSALDNHSEHLVQVALKRLMVGKTVIVIAHRLSTIVDADKIFVMDKGQIIAQGTHQNLLHGSVHYQSLFNKKSTV